MTTRSTRPVNVQAGWSGNRQSIAILQTPAIPSIQDVEDDLAVERIHIYTDSHDQGTIDDVLTHAPRARLIRFWLHVFFNRFLVIPRIPQHSGSLLFLVRTSTRSIFSTSSSYPLRRFGHFDARLSPPDDDDCRRLFSLFFSSSCSTTAKLGSRTRDCRAYSTLFEPPREQGLQFSLCYARKARRRTFRSSSRRRQPTRRRRDISTGTAGQSRREDEAERVHQTRETRG